MMLDLAEGVWVRSARVAPPPLVAPVESHTICPICVGDAATTALCTTFGVATLMAGTPIDPSSIAQITKTARWAALLAAIPPLNLIPFVAAADTDPYFICIYVVESGVLTRALARPAEPCACMEIIGDLRQASAHVRQQRRVNQRGECEGEGGVAAAVPRCEPPSPDLIPPVETRDHFIHTARHGIVDPDILRLARAEGPRSRSCIASIPCVLGLARLTGAFTVDC